VDPDGEVRTTDRPRADARRGPNNIANTAIASATYSALSCHGDGDSSDARVNRPKLIATAFSCRAMYGTMPSTATKVTAAARPELLPRRVAIRSAIEVEFCSRAMRCRWRRNPKPSR